MVREVLKNHYIGMNKEFRYRGEEPTRIETLSDAGFALAIGLLLISTSSPTTFSELLQFTADVIPFGLCISLIMFVWYEHFKFFIRYGFRNRTIVFLNTLLLFIILFYVYPLKFLSRLLMKIYGEIFGYDASHSIYQTHITTQEVPQLMIIYGFGAAAIFLTLMFMYRYALKNAEELELNELEVFDTRVSVYSNLLMTSIPLLSVFLALVIPNPGIASAVSGFSYFLYTPAMIIFGRTMDKKRKAILDGQVVTLPSST